MMNDDVMIIDYANYHHHHHHPWQYAKTLNVLTMGIYGYKYVVNKNNNNININKSKWYQDTDKRVKDTIFFRKQHLLQQQQQQQQQKLNIFVFQQYRQMTFIILIKFKLTGGGDFYEINKNKESICILYLFIIKIII